MKELIENLICIITLMMAREGVDELQFSDAELEKSTKSNFGKQITFEVGDGIMVVKMERLEAEARREYIEINDMLDSSRGH